MKIGLVANTSWYIYNFRSSLILELVKAGHSIHVFSQEDQYSHLLTEIGACMHNWPIGRRNINPLLELKSQYFLMRLIKIYDIDVILSFTPKGNIHSSLACLMLGNRRVINNISGLGTITANTTFLTSLISQMYRFLLKHSAMVFFQNRDDMAYLFKSENESKYYYRLLPGSGVDLTKFIPNATEQACDYDFLLSARLLKEKGVYDYIEAIKLVKKEFPTINCAISGPLEKGSKSCITTVDLNKWQNENIADYLGFTDNICEYLRKVKIVVLPSYYGEGVPRSLLEAASMSKPIITTDHPGCKEAVNDGITGLLCKTRNPIDLANKMMRMLSMSNSDLKKMGELGRNKMVAEFDEKIVIDQYLKVINYY